MSDPILNKLAKILRQAEAASTEHEADAFMRAAQQLSTKYSYDLEVARQHQVDTERRKVPVVKQIQLGERGKRGLRTFVHLFSGIARANDVTINIAHNSTYVVCFGFEADIEVVEALYGSLLYQMVAASKAYLRSEEHKHDYVSTGYWGDEKKVSGTTARINFQEAFASRVSQRLLQARQTALAEIQAEQDALDPGTEPAAIGTGTDTEPAASGTELVLKTKRDAVDELYKEKSTARGTWKGGSQQTRQQSSQARRAGYAAGSSARLSASKGIGGSRPAVER